MNKAILGVKKVNTKKTEYFVTIEDGKARFSDNPIQGFTSSDKDAIKTIADALSLSDKRNTYEPYSITIH
jgi:hypothetical protein